MKKFKGFTRTNFIKNLSGFTLIELLIVIALLGALAAGLLAAIDPFEQLKKGTDTSIRGQAESLYNATIAYYAQRAQLPTGLASGVTYTASNLGNVISDLAAAGELKADFFDLAGIGKLSKIIVNVPNSESIVVCYTPQSKAFRNDQYTKYDFTGLTIADCPGSAGCYQCFK